MSPNIKDLTVEELEELIRNTVQETIDEYLEDLEALSSDSFRSSIEKARKEYQNGDFNTLEELIND